MTQVTVSFEWRAVGSIRVEGGRPAFPAVDDVPGVYRLTFERLDSAPDVYIGESDRLHRRAQHYRTPGPRQPTNVRMNQEFVTALSAGVPVTVSIVTAATIEVDGAGRAQLDLSRKTGRLILENAAMAAVIAERDRDPIGGPILLNRPGVGEGEWR
jgi:hypothetical protein